MRNFSSEIIYFFSDSINLDSITGIIIQKKNVTAQNILKDSAKSSATLSSTSPNLSRTLPNENSTAPMNSKKKVKLDVFLSF
ncbi:hypothetical protein ES703_66464 [subsurface metagenome]